MDLDVSVHTKQETRILVYKPPGKWPLLKPKVSLDNSKMDHWEVQGVYNETPEFYRILRK
jgi:hypothetical protein